jgi:hypothetical protein
LGAKSIEGGRLAILKMQEPEMPQRHAVVLTG